MKFSLLSSLLVTTIVALSVVVWRQHRELVPLRRDVQRYRDAAGELTIGDSSRVHAIRLRCPCQWTWEWKIYVPEGRSRTLRYQLGSLPDSGYPSTSAYYDLRPGEHTVSLRVEWQAHERSWGVELKEGNGRYNGPSFGNDAWFPTESAQKQGMPGVGYTTQAAAPDERLLLMEHRVDTGDIPGMICIPAIGLRDGQKFSPQGGLMVWIDPF